MRLMRFVSWGLMLALVAHAVATYGTLPEQVPTHLDLSGKPDRFSERSVLSWFALPTIALLLLILFEVLTRMMPSRPHLINIPDKERFLALPRRWQAPVIAEVILFMDVTAAGVVAVFGLVQWQLARIATGSASGGTGLSLIVPMFLSVGLLLLVSRVTTAVESAEKAWKAAGAPRE
jgi:uncharacterized membrane protein